MSALVAVVLWLLPTWTAAQPMDPLPMSEVADGVFVYEAPIALARPDNLGAIANLGFIIGQEAVAVIDTGGSRAAGERLLGAVRARTLLPIHYVINTHVHPDHVLGNAAFAELPGVRFVGHRNLPEALAARRATYLKTNAELLGQAFAGTAIVPPTLLVDDTAILNLGGRSLRVEAWPTAHTNTDLTVLDEASDTWFLGDLLFVRHVPALDGKLKGWLTTLRQLKSQPAKRVVPGHGPASVAWPDASLAMERYLEQLDADVGAMVKEGRPLREAAREAGRSGGGSWLLFDEFATRNATSAYQEKEWE